MKFIVIALLAVLSGGLLAQDAPVVSISANGVNVPNSGGISVAPSSTFNGMALSYTVTDPQNDPVGVSATVSNVAAAVNWDETTFNKVPLTTPWQVAVTSPSGTFGPANTVHVVTLTFSDGVNDTIFSFTIAVDPTPPAQQGLPGDDGGACTATGGTLPLAIACVMFALLILRRRATSAARS